MELVLVVHINKSFEEAKKSILKNINDDMCRKSIKDMTIKYWSYKSLKNKLPKCIAVAGIKKGKICSAYKVDGFTIVNRLGKNDKFSERVEFFCKESWDELVGLDLGKEEELSRGGWCTKLYELKYLQSLVYKQYDEIKKNRLEIFEEYRNIGIDYNPENTYNYPQHYYGKQGSSYMRSESIRKQTHERSNYTCEYCGKVKENLYCHHIELLSKGGKDIIENTMTLCNDCHHYVHSVKDYDNSMKPYLKSIREKAKNISFK